MAKTGSTYEQYLRQNEKHLICRLGGTKTEPNKYVGFHEGPHDLQENGEGIAYEETRLGKNRVSGSTMPQSSNRYRHR